MRLFSNKKSLSRERVIGISLADILLQAVFLLFIALIIGYKDPQQLLLIQKYEQLGRDLCNKKNPDSLKECKEQEIIKDQSFIEVGKKLCEGKYEKNHQKCIKEYLNAMDFKKNKGNTMACMPINNKDWYKAVEFHVYGGDEIEFVRFTEEYENYLIRQNDRKRQAQVNEIKKKKGERYTGSELEKTFKFIRQNDCFHQATYRSRKKNIELSEYSHAVNALYLR